MRRLAKVNELRIIERCFWGDDNEVNNVDVLYAPEPWAQEGVDYDVAKTAYEQAQQTEVMRRQSIDLDSRVSDLYTKLKTMNAQQLVDYVQNGVIDLATAKVLLVRIVLLLAAKL